MIDKIRKLAILALILSLHNALAFGKKETLRVYSNVPGLTPSDKYEIRVRPAGSDLEWSKPFAFITRCKKAIKGGNKYFSHLSGWSNTYVNFEMDAPVEIEVSKVNGRPIKKATAHPQRKAKASSIRDGKAYLTIDKPCQITIDIDGQMDDQDTGKGYKGDPIHTLTIFANHFIDTPDLNDPSVYAVKPGEEAPSEGSWKTLYFLPGVHRIGVGFPVHANRNYYIPGDAIVHGTLSNHGKWNDGHDIKIFGYGVLSGAEIPHPEHASPQPKKHDLHDPIQIVGAANTSVEGITIEDSSYHTLMLISSFQPEKPTNIRWVKIFTWRANGDGINPFANGLVEDCFIRTQDDSIYINGRGIRRVTFWNDYNGSTFVLSAMPNRKIIVEDCDIIYARSGWEKWAGGRLFNMRGEGKGECGEGVIFKNINVEDKRPTLQHFMIAMEGIPPYSDPAERKRGAGNLTGILFQNINIAAPSVIGEPDVLWGSPDAEIINLTFDNLTIGGKKIMDLRHFKHNKYVKKINFK